MPPMKSLTLPELRLWIDYAQLPSQNTELEWNRQTSLPTNDQYHKRVAEVEEGILGWKEKK